MAVLLIVDDDLSSVETIAEVLEEEGFVVARSADAGIDAAEVAQRLRERLRQRGSEGGDAPRMLAVGDLAVDLLTRDVRRGRRTISLAPREYEMLVYLMRNTGRVVRRDTLFEAVWRYRHAQHSNVVEVHVARLRRKVDAEGARPMIFTVRGAGYVLTDARG